MPLSAFPAEPGDERPRRNGYLRTFISGSLPTLLAALFACTAGANAQCVSDLRGEVRGLTAISDSLVKSFGGAKATRDSAKVVLQNSEIFGAKALAAGPAAQCILERQTTYLRAAVATLPDTVSPDQFRQAVTNGVAAVLSERYTSSDRISLIFGIGMTTVFDKTDTEEWKIISRPGTPVPGGPTPPPEQRFLANTSDSKQFPTATTGVLVTFWDPGPARAPYGKHWLRNASRRLAPSGVFGSIQISDAGDTGPVNGVSLGLSWKIVASSQFLIGYSITRFKTLRDDLRTGIDPDKLVPLPPGETEQTILGTETTNGLMFALALPISLKSALGRE
jgi:hypothetical protein